MELQFEVANVKCAGCANTIESALRADPRLNSVSVELQRQVVTVEAPAEVRHDIAATLARLGYPAKGSVDGLKPTAAVAKSFVRRAIGRLSDRA
jgi:copper chaperone